MAKTSQVILFGLAVMLLLVGVAGIILYMQSAPIEDNLRMQVIVGYADGSVWAVQSDDWPLGMAIIDPANQGREVSWIKVELYITPQFTGTVSSYRVSGTLKCMIYEGYTRVYDSGDMGLQPVNPLPPLTSGVPVVITSATITAADLERLYGGWKDGQSYQLVWKVSSIAMTINFADGHSETKLPTNNLPYLFAWDFKYKATTGSFQGFSISFNKVIGYK